MSRLQRHLKLISNADHFAHLSGIMRGIEKESLRVTGRGTLAMTPHSKRLGSAMTHPEITTDFSEALLEFITPPTTDVAASIQRLNDIHHFTYQVLEDEYLWVNSMPCVLAKDEDSIPVGRYGSSNAALMRTVYRLGLGHRYGRLMQTIAGIHYNFSLPDDFWIFLRAAEQSTLELQDFKTQRYFDLIRNFRRYFWLLLYVFGAAPAICPSFIHGREHSLTPLDDSGTTLHAPYATSLRMGDLGYQSKAQESLHVDYNCLPDYVRTLCEAITQPHPDYEVIGVKDEQGNYKQLNTGILQIENEFYGPIRPKRTATSGEAALRALYDRGVEYIEVRCLDLDPYQPVGIGAEQMYFLDTFLLFCLLEDSPLADNDEHLRVQENQQRMVYQGRNPELELLDHDGPRSFVDWAQELIEQLKDVAGLLDAANQTDVHSRSVMEQAAKVLDSSLTPSARVLADLRADGLSFYEFALQQALQHSSRFRNTALPQEVQQRFETLAAESLAKQAELEEQPQADFDQYLADFYAQYQCCFGS